MGDNTTPQIPRMLQATSRACHALGLPPPDGLVFDEETGKYVVDPDHPLADKLKGK